MLILVEPLRYRSVRPPHKIYTGGLGSCLALGVLVPDRAYLLHIYTGPVDIERVATPFFSRLQREVEHPADSKWFLAGGYGGSAKDLEYLREAQHRLLVLKAQFGFQDAPLEVRLGTSELTLSPLHQRAEFQERSDEELGFLEGMSF